MCDWPVHLRACDRNGVADVGPLSLCTQHFEIALTGLARTAGQDEHYAAVLRRELRRAEIGRKALEQEERWQAEGRPPVVYFAEREGLVKIGTTVNLTQRMLTIAAGGSMVPGMTVGAVRLLATVPGGIREEKKLHRKFRHHRIDQRHEWFRFGPDLQAFVKTLANDPQ